MKTFLPIFAALAALFALALDLRSQAPVAKSPAEQLAALRTKNAELIEQQKATLLRLEEIDKQAEQVRFLGKRG